MEKEAQNPDFWGDKDRATEVNQEISDIQQETETIKAISSQINELEELGRLSAGDEALLKDIAERYQELEKTVKKLEFQAFFSGEYDKNNAILEIFSGAGGIDAQDWATLLLRMYERYCSTMGFQTKILHQSFGEGGGPEGRIGTKAATMEIKGKYAYGFLKRESGVHRLVRISPFSSQKLRHTSFALAEILPEIEEKNAEINIKPEDLKIETFRASGPGGQYVNRRESAIRITHIATGIVVASQSERLQGKNKESAMKVLYAKLYQLKELNRKKEIDKIKGPAISASWGNQIRSYVLHPYKMVKDLRTGLETSSAEKVLDGDLADFIEAEIKQNDNAK